MDPYSESPNRLASLLQRERKVDPNRPKALSRQANALPHSHETGDHYQFGNVYQQNTNRSSRPWATDTTGMPYLQHIEAVAARGWPHLRYLADFMHASTSPLKWKLLEAGDVRERAARTRVAVLTFFADGRPTTRQDVTCSEDLVNVLRQTTTAKNDDGDDDGYAARLFVVEDLSRSVIEALGGALDVDPLFFRDQFNDHIWYNVKDPWVEMPDLAIFARRRPFFHVRYVQTRYFENQESFDRAREQAGAFNVFRRPDNDYNHKEAFDGAEAMVARIRSRMSFWHNSPSSEGKTPVIGILLVDPTIQEGHPLWMGYRNFARTPSMNPPNPNPASSSSSSSPSSGPPGTSTFDAVAHWSQSLSAHDLARARADPRVLGLHALATACAEWRSLIQYINTRLAQIEWELEEPAYRKDARGLDASLQKLHPWRRSVPAYYQFVAEAMDRVFPEQAEEEEDGDGAATAAAGKGLDALRPDFKIILGKISALESRVERIVAVAAAIINIDEARRSVEQNRNFGRLTYLAVIFVPATLVSSFFSMTPDVGALGQTFTLYASVALPFTAMALLVTLHYDRLQAVGRAFRRPRERTAKEDGTAKRKFTFSGMLGGTVDDKAALGGAV